MHTKSVALVTGANQGIGLQIAKDLATHGFTVLVGSRNLERGEAAAREVGPTRFQGGRVPETVASACRDDLLTRKPDRISDKPGQRVDNGHPESA